MKDCKLDNVPSSYSRFCTRNKRRQVHSWNQSQLQCEGIITNEGQESANIVMSKVWVGNGLDIKSNWNPIKH